MIKIFNYGQQLVDADQSTKDPNITRHPQQFMEAIEAAINYLDDMDGKVAPVFINLGRHHIYFKVSHYF